MLRLWGSKRPVCGFGIDALKIRLGRGDGSAMQKMMGHRHAKPNSRSKEELNSLYTDTHTLENPVSWTYNGHDTWSRCSSLPLPTSLLATRTVSVSGRGRARTDAKILRRK